MANRREFLQGTIAVSALPLIGGMAAPFAANASPLARIVFDERLPASRAFAERATQSGIPTHAFKGDITSLWFNELHQRWMKQPEAVAGLTEPAALFCLERLAWDYKMRVTYLAEHRASETIADARWIDAIAHEVMSPRAAQAPIFGASAVGIARHENDFDRPLISWVIAPVKSTRVA
ncbi:MAG: hypothetical protein WAW96_20825 [Alphaproteobacteria bacterium]